MEERLCFVARLLDGETMTDVCRCATPTSSTWHGFTLRRIPNLHQSFKTLANGDTVARCLGGITLFAPKYE
jgi:hypothetical protein